MSDGPQASIEESVKDALIVPETKPLDDLLADLQRERARWRSSWTSTAARPASSPIEDIIEEVVGEIADETDPSWRGIRRLANGDWWVRGHVPITDLADYGLDLPVDSEAYNSVGGYVFGELGRLPKRGDMVQANGYSVRVESVRENRIEAVRIRDHHAACNRRGATGPVEEYLRRRGWRGASQYRRGDPPGRGDPAGGLGVRRLSRPRGARRSGAPGLVARQDGFSPIEKVLGARGEGRAQGRRARACGRSSRGPLGTRARAGAQCVARTWSRPRGAARSARLPAAQGRAPLGLGSPSGVRQRLRGTDVVGPEPVDEEVDLRAAGRVAGPQGRLGRGASRRATMAMRVDSRRRRRRRPARAPAAGR